MHTRRNCGNGWKMNKQRDIERAMAKRHERELMSAIHRSRYEHGGKKWEAAPPDPGVKSGGIRDRAWKAAINRQKEPVNETR
jgi:hypothetical protein